MKNKVTQLRLLSIKTSIKKYFNKGQWGDIALLTNSNDIIFKHPRLIKSLYFGDDDYEVNIVEVLQKLQSVDSDNINTIENYINEKFGDNSLFISAKPSYKKITFAPSVFNIPEETMLENDLISVMMPFSPSFASVYTGIKESCVATKFKCLRADDIWEESTFVQDIFNLIYKSKAVIVDYTGKNPNVLYETGIAHTLGKIVVPITQSISDIPSDLGHHRALLYLNNGEGISNFKNELINRLKVIKGDSNF